MIKTAENTTKETEPQGKMSKLHRVLFWIGGIMAAAIALPVLAIIGAIFQNQNLKSGMGDFCNTFRVGQSLTPSEAMRRANDERYEARTGNVRPLDRPGDPLPTVLVSKMSWSGTMWRCTVQFEQGRISAAEFRGRGLAD